MIFKASLPLAIAASVLLTACNAATGPSPTASNTEPAVTLATFSPGRLKADVEFLANDLLKGRNTGSEGYLLAANYMAATYKRLGVQPLGEDGGYFQDVAFATGQVDTEQSMVSVTVGGETKTLKPVSDYLMFGSVRDTEAEATGDLVFAGYGIHAPEVGYSDLAELDLNGKIAVIMRSAPEGLGSEIRAHFRSSASKAPTLEERGAVGMIMIDPLFFSERMTDTRRESFLKRGSFSWTAPEGSDLSVSLAAAISLNPSEAAPLFEGAKMSLDEVMEAKAAGNMPTFPLMASATIKKTTKLVDPITSPNVVGLIPGSDPNLRDEYVVLSAHLDHVGTNEKLDGDKIFNGAMDNATGSSVLLEVARAYMMNGIKPRRSILLLSVTAEEKGLLGAEYFAHFPTVPVDSLVANVNLDMPILLYKFADVVAFGAEHSSLGPITEAAAAKAGISVTPDPLPEENLFVRSDHYRFVQQGIPAVFLMTGFLETEDGRVGGDIFREFLGTHYHKPSDQPDLPIDYEAGAKFAFVNFLIANEIANADDRPTWNEGDFFGNIYARD